MIFEQRKVSFIELGKILGQFEVKTPWPGFSSGLTEEEYNNFSDLIVKVKHHNGWFTEDNVRKSLAALSDMLTTEKVNKWLGEYAFSETVEPKTIAIILAGNIPLVGFHDFLCVLLSGNNVLIKTSSEDAQLLPAVVSLLLNIAPELEANIIFSKRKLEGMDAVIATGSNNTSRYFNHYFGKYPNIIRKNRNSIAVLTGEETEEEMVALGHDVFDYFGLGCRNVSKLLFPKGYDKDHFFKGMFPYQNVTENNKYANNYDYHKAILLMDGVELLENGFMLLREAESIATPVSLVHYTEYNSPSEVAEYLAAHADEIQCVVGKNHLPFGTAQQPELWDYADGVDTMAFLLEL